MEILAGTLYDPAGAVSFACTGTRAITALDTTNLRLSFTARSGLVLVKMRTTLSGATTMPQILLGVLDGATVKGRQVPMGALPGTAVATTNVPLWAEFVVATVSGTAYNWDAAVGVETPIASTNIHYGGPNNTTANDAWGGFAFEIWDTKVFNPVTVGTNNDKTGYSLSTPQSFNLIGNVSGTWVGNQTGTFLGNRIGNIQGFVANVTGSVGGVVGLTPSLLDVAVSSRMASGTVTVGTNNDKSGYSLTNNQVVNFSGTITNVYNVLNPVTAVQITGAVNVIGLNPALLDVAVSSRMASGTVVVAGLTPSYLDTPVSSRMVSGTVTVGVNTDKTNYLLQNNQIVNFSGTITNVYNVLDSVVISGSVVVAGLNTAYIDVPISSRLASGTVSVAGLNASLLDVAVSSRLASGTYTVPPTASQISTQVLSDAAASPISSNIKKVNDVTLHGDGNTTPWGP